MDTQSQELFDKILSMDQANLTEDQKGFLVARRDYMNDEQRKRYADMIEEHEENMDKPKKGGDSTEKPLSKMTVAELKTKAEQLEIKGFEDMTKGELVEAIEEATA